MQKFLIYDKILNTDNSIYITCLEAVQLCSLCKVRVLVIYMTSIKEI